LEAVPKPFQTGRITAGKAADRVAQFPENAGGKHLPGQV